MSGGGNIRPPPTVAVFHVGTTLTMEPGGANGKNESTDGPNTGLSGSESESLRERRSGGFSDWAKAFREVAPYLDLGWRLAGAAAFPPLLGVAFDVWWDTAPWGLLLGCVLGLSAALVQLKGLQDDLDA